MYTYDIVSSNGIIVVNQNETSLFGFCCGVGIPEIKIKYNNFENIRIYLPGSHFSIFSENDKKEGLHSFVKELYNHDFIGEIHVQLNTNIQDIYSRMIKENKYIKKNIKLYDAYVCSSPFENKYFVFTNRKIEELTPFEIFKYFSDGEKRYRYLVEKDDVERLIKNV